MMKLQQHDSKYQQIIIACAAITFIALIWFKLPSIVVGVIAFAPIAIALTLRMPFALCLAFIAFSFFRIHEIFPFLSPLRIPQLLALATLVSLVFNLLVGRVDLFFSRELAVFSFFCTLVVLGALLATNRAAAMHSLTGTYLKIAVMVFAISWLLRTKRQFKAVLFTMLFCGAITGIVTLHNKIQGIELVEGTRVTIGRSIGSMLGDPNDLALVLLFPASFALSLILTKNISFSVKAIATITFLTIVCAIIATQSRGGLLGIATVCSLFAWRRIKNKALLISCAVLGFSMLFLVAGIDGRASGGGHEQGIDESAMGRIYAWQAAIGMAIHHPLTGVGINNFISNYFEYSPFWDGKNHAVHSTWFGVLAETGILGFSVFLSLIVMLNRLSSRCISYLTPDKPYYDPILSACAQASQAGLAGFCVSGSFLTMGFTWPLYILLAVTVALAQYLKEQRSIK